LLLIDSTQFVYSDNRSRGVDTMVGNPAIADGAEFIAINRTLPEDNQDHHADADHESQGHNYPQHVGTLCE
jgi:hypothetical protein